MSWASCYDRPTQMRKGNSLKSKDNINVWGESGRDIFPLIARTRVLGVQWTCAMFCASINYDQTCVVHLPVYLYPRSCFPSLTTYHALARIPSTSRLQTGLVIDVDFHNSLHHTMARPNIEKRGRKTPTSKTTSRVAKPSISRVTRSETLRRAAM